MSSCTERLAETAGVRPGEPGGSTESRSSYAAIASSIDDVASLAGLSKEIGRQALMIGYLNAFHMFAFTAFAVIPVILMVKIGRR